MIKGIVTVVKKSGFRKEESVLEVPARKVLFGKYDGDEGTGRMEQSPYRKQGRMKSSQNSCGSQ